MRRIKLVKGLKEKFFFSTKRAREGKYPTEF